MRIEIEPKELVELVRVLRDRAEIHIKDTPFEKWRKTKVIGPIEATAEEVAQILKAIGCEEDKSK